MFEDNKTLCLVVPCYNEEGVLEDSVRKLTALLDDLRRQTLVDEASCMLLVDDGSSDRTWEIITGLAADFPGAVRGVSLAANRGQQLALLAGLSEAVRFADVIISLDADLQDDITVIPDFLREYYNGHDIVYGVRSDRHADSFFKRFTAETFYMSMRLIGVKTVFNHADFRLMSARAVKELLNYSEVNFYLRGLVPILGFRQSIVMYRRAVAERPTHYSLRKMLSLAWEGITSFSVRPIRAITLLGLLMFVACIGLFGYIMYSKFIGETVQGWASIVTVSLFLGSFQLLAIGITGEYIAKIYMEVKRRPRFCIRERVGSDGK
jgi:glycosyltransferase involved in cell wall biosynthesis